MFASQEELIQHVTGLLENVSDEARKFPFRFEFPNTPADMDEPITLQFTPLIKLEVLEKRHDIHEGVRSSNIVVKYLDLIDLEYYPIDGATLFQKNRFIGQLALGQNASMFLSWGRDLIRDYCEQTCRSLIERGHDHFDVALACAELGDSIEDRYIEEDMRYGQPLSSWHDDHLIDQLSERYNMHHLIKTYTLDSIVARPNTMLPDHMALTSQLQSVAPGLTMNDLAVLYRYGKALTEVATHGPQLYVSAVAHAIRQDDNILVNLLGVSGYGQDWGLFQSFIERKFSGSPRYKRQYQNLSHQEIEALQTDIVQFHRDWSPLAPTEELLAAFAVKDIMQSETLSVGDHAYNVPKLASLARSIEVALRFDNKPATLTKNAFIHEDTLRTLQNAYEDLGMNSPTELNNITMAMMRSYILQGPEYMTESNWTPRTIANAVHELGKTINQKLSDISEVCQALSRAFWLRTEQSANDLVTFRKYIPGAIRQNTSVTAELLCQSGFGGDFSTDHLFESHIIDPADTITEDDMLFAISEIIQFGARLLINNIERLPPDYWDYDFDEGMEALVLTTKLIGNLDYLPVDPVHTEGLTVTNHALH